MSGGTRVFLLDFRVIWLELLGFGDIRSKDVWLPSARRCTHPAPICLFIRRRFFFFFLLVGL